MHVPVAHAQADRGNAHLVEFVRVAASAGAHVLRIDATRVARDLSQQRLDAELKKFQVGMSTSFLIVQAQRDLSQAAANELRALIDYVKAFTAFERAQGIILDGPNITIR